MIQPTHLNRPGLGRYLAGGLLAGGLYLLISGAGQLGGTSHATALDTTATAFPTYTPYPTFTPAPTYTPYPTLTAPATATATARATATLPPTYTPYPTLIALPTYTPYPTYTPFPAATATATATRTPGATATATATAIPCQDSFDPAGEPGNARPLTVGETQHHLFCPAGESDWLRFFGKAGKAYRITTGELSPGVDTYLNLFAPDGQTLLLQNDDAPGLHGVSLLLFVPVADGWYFIQAKNQGDVGGPGLGYTLSLFLADVPTATASATPTATATAPPTATAFATLPSAPGVVPPPMFFLPTLTSLPTVTPVAPPSAPASPTPGLVLVPAGAGQGGLPALLAGSPAATAPDLLEPNDTFEQARALDVGLVYQNLNFVPNAGQLTDGEFYTLRVKPGNCYTFQTGDLGPALDTTLLLWRPSPWRQDRVLLAQNDDAVAHSPALGSVLHWCQPLTAPDAQELVLEVHNYGGGPATSPIGQTYSLLATIDPPPTVTPTRTPRPPATPFVPNTGGAGGSSSNTGQPAGAPVPAAPTPPRPLPLPVPPTNLPLPVAPVVPPVAATATPPGAVTATATATPLPSTPSMTATPTVTATPAPVTVSLDVIVYSGDSAAGLPPPGSVIADYPVSLVVLRTNTLLPNSTVRTDANGHAHLTWTWTEPVVLTVPEGRWTSSPWLSAADVQRLSGPIYAHLPVYPLPSRWP
ncbi:MAG: PPC domain-containing protein [Chloroflexota bacterium]|nr:PPC domain-containing protein [Chloroflexota bacterium]